MIEPGSTYSVEHIDKGFIFKQDGAMKAFILSNGTINTGCGAITTASLNASTIYTSTVASGSVLTLQGTSLKIYDGTTFGSAGYILTSGGTYATWKLNDSSVNGETVSIGSSSTTIQIGNTLATTTLWGTVTIPTLNATGISTTTLTTSGLISANGINVTTKGITVVGGISADYLRSTNSVSTATLTTSGLISANGINVTTNGITVVGGISADYLRSANSVLTATLTTTGLITANGINVTTKGITVVGGISADVLKTTQLITADGGINVTTKGITVVGGISTDVLNASSVVIGGINTSSIQINSVAGSNGQVIGIINNTLGWVTTSGSGITPTLYQICTQGASTSQLIFANGGITTTGLTAIGISTTTLQSTGLISANGINVTTNGITVVGGISADVLKTTQLITADGGINVTTKGITVVGGISADYLRSVNSVLTATLTTSGLISANGINVTTKGITVVGGISADVLKTTQLITADGGINVTTKGITVVGGISADYLRSVNSVSTATLTTSGLISANGINVTTNGITVVGGISADYLRSVNSVSTATLTTTGLITANGINVTTNGITVVGGISADVLNASSVVVGGINTSSIQINSVSGSNGQVIGIATGALAWVTPSGSGTTPTLDQVCTQGATTLFPVTVGGLTSTGISTQTIYALDATATGSLFTNTSGQITIGNGSNTNRIGNLTIIGNALNNPNAAFPCNIANTQIDGQLFLGTSSTRTGNINIGANNCSIILGGTLNANVGLTATYINTSSIQINSVTGSNGQVLGMSSGVLTWITSSGSIPTLDQVCTQGATTNQSLLLNTITTSIINVGSLIIRGISINSSSTGPIEIGVGQTSGQINIGFNPSRTASATIYIGNTANTNKIGNLAVIGGVLHHINTTTGTIEIGTGQTSGLIIIGNNASRTASATIFIGNNVNTNKIGNLAVIGNGLHHVNTTGTIEIGLGQTSGKINIGTNATRTAAGIISIGTGNTAITQIGNLVINGYGLYNTITDTGTIDIGTVQTSGQINIGNNTTRTSAGIISIGSSLSPVNIGGLINAQQGISLADNTFITLGNYGTTTGITSNLGYRVQIPITATPLPLTLAGTGNIQTITHSITLPPGTWLITGSQSFSLVNNPILNRSVFRMNSGTSTTFFVNVDASMNGNALDGTQYITGGSQVIPLSVSTVINLIYQFSYSGTNASMQLASGNANYFYATRIG